MGFGTRSGSHTLGIEISHGVARAAQFDRNLNVIVGVAEVSLPLGSCDSAGVFDPSLARVCLEGLLDRLALEDRSSVQVGVAIGPRNSGVGSGPTMKSWLEAQAARLGQAVSCTGGTGVSFAPSRAVDAAAKAMLELGLEPVRVDLAPVAAARAYGRQVDGALCVGSGRGWRARMRNMEVLEAMEDAHVAADESLTVLSVGGRAVKVSELAAVGFTAEVHSLVGTEAGRAAVAVGAALGVVHGSGSNLMDGSVIGGEPARVVPPPARSRERRAAEPAEEDTLTLRNRAHSAPLPRHRRTAAEVSDSARPALPRSSAEVAASERHGSISSEDTTVLTRLPKPSVAAVAPKPSVAAPVKAAAALATPTVAPRPRHRSGGAADPAGHVVVTDPSNEIALDSLTPTPAAPTPAAPARKKVQAPQHRTGQVKAVSVGPDTQEQAQIREMTEWEDQQVDQTDPINLFSPQTSEAHLLGQSEHGFSILHLLLILTILGVAAAVGAFILL